MNQKPKTKSAKTQTNNSQDTSKNSNAVTVEDKSNSMSGVWIVIALLFFIVCGGSSLVLLYFVNSRDSWINNSEESNQTSAQEDPDDFWNDWTEHKGDGESGEDDNTSDKEEQWPEQLDGLVPEFSCGQIDNMWDTEYYSVKTSWFYWYEEVEKECFLDYRTQLINDGWTVSWEDLDPDDTFAFISYDLVKDDMRVQGSFFEDGNASLSIKIQN